MSEDKKEKNPRFWSNKFWNKKNISDVLQEVIEPDSVNVSSIKMNKELSSDIFDSDMIMIPEVRNALLKNAYEFIKFSKLEKLKFKDIILTGSLANYNYNDESDLDVHILLDFDQISENQEFVGEFLLTKKDLWKEKLPIKVKNHDVELYYQNINEPHSSTGIYSLINDEWVTRPVNKMINIDIGNVQLKAADFMNAIDNLESIKDDQKIINSVRNLTDKLKKYRTSGLRTEGEFSTENLVFKILRNNGYLKKMSNMKKEALTDELTLKEDFI